VVLAILLLLAWSLVDPEIWWLGVAAAALFVLGVAQMMGRVPSL
jgi:hypothetical protein